MDGDVRAQVPYFVHAAVTKQLLVALFSVREPRDNSFGSRLI